MIVNGVRIDVEGPIVINATLTESDLVCLGKTAQVKVNTAVTEIKTSYDFWMNVQSMRFTICDKVISGFVVKQSSELLYSEVALKAITNEFNSRFPKNKIAKSEMLEIGEERVFIEVESVKTLNKIMQMPYLLDLLEEDYDEIEFSYDAYKVSAGLPEKAVLKGEFVKDLLVELDVRRFFANKKAVYGKTNVMSGF